MEMWSTGYSRNHLKGQTEIPILFSTWIILLMIWVVFKIRFILVCAMSGEAWPEARYFTLSTAVSQFRDLALRETLLASKQKLGFRHNLAVNGASVRPLEGPTLGAMPCLFFWGR